MIPCTFFYTIFNKKKNTFIDVLSLFKSIKKAKKYINWETRLIIIEQIIIIKKKISIKQELDKSATFVRNNNNYLNIY